MTAPLPPASAFSQQKQQKQQQKLEREQQRGQQKERARQPKDPQKRLQRQLKSQRRRQKLYGRQKQQDGYSQKFRQQRRGAAADSNRGGYGAQHKRSHEQSQSHEPERDAHKPVNARAQNRRSLDGGYNGGDDGGYNGIKDGGYNGSKDAGHNGVYNRGYNGSYNRSYNGGKDAGHNGSYDAGRVRRSDDVDISRHRSPLERRSHRAHEYAGDAQRVRKSPLQYPSQDGGGGYGGRDVGGYDRRDDRRRSYDEGQEQRSR